jgi:hypothetical protein
VACAAALATLAVLQLALTRPLEVQPAGWSGGGTRGGLPQITAVNIEPVLRRSIIFMPQRTAQANAAPGAGGTVVPSGPILAGTISLRGRVFGVFQRADGSVAYVPVGGSIGGMRLSAVNEAGGIVRRGGKSERLAFGRQPIAPPSSGENVEEQE